MRTGEERLLDLAMRVASGDRASVTGWFRLLGNIPAPSYLTPRVRAKEFPTHLEHLVPVRVFADRLLDGSMTVHDVPGALQIVLCLEEENKRKILKLMGKGGRTEVYRALLNCPPAELPAIASWRYLAVGIRLIGYGRRSGFLLKDAPATAELVRRRAASA